VVVDDISGLAHTVSGLHLGNAGVAVVEEHAGCDIPRLVDEMECSFADVFSFESCFVWH